MCEMPISRKLLRLQITPEQLSLTGEHPELGEVTLEQLLATWVVHDLNHIRQIVTYMAKIYDDEVGPWKRILVYPELKNASPITRRGRSIQVITS